MALGIVVVGGNMDPADYYNKTQADKLLAGKLGLHDDADNGVVASGSNYVRFGDGTQIWFSPPYGDHILNISQPIEKRKSQKVGKCSLYCNAVNLHKKEQMQTLRL